MKYKRIVEVALLIAFIVQLLLLPDHATNLLSPLLILTFFVINIYASLSSGVIGTRHYLAKKSSQPILYWAANTLLFVACFIFVLIFLQELLKR
jgi:hypothetical protein